MALICVDRRVQFLNYRYDKVKGVNRHGAEIEVDEAVLLDQVTVAPGVTTKVPDWVLQTKHFKLLEKDGLASAV
jgi:hypothetical protein